MLSNTILMATAAILGMTAAQSNVVITYNCATYASECASNVNAGNTAISVCSRGFEACLDCNAHEFACRVSAGNSYPGQLNCTSDSEVCYNNAVSPGQTSGYYGCEQAQNSCVNGPMENESLCASQNSACKGCQEAENKCRNAPGENESLCSSEASTCFADAVTSGGRL